MAIGQVVSHIPLCCRRTSCGYCSSWAWVQSAAGEPAPSTILLQGTSPVRLRRRLVALAASWLSHKLFPHAQIKLLIS